MTIPALVLGIVLSTLMGALFHVWRGGGPGRLVLYLVLAWTGFWGGHVLAGLQKWNFVKYGALNLGTATLVCLMFLIAGHWLSQIEIQPKE